MKTPFLKPRLVRWTVLLLCAFHLTASPVADARRRRRRKTAAERAKEKQARKLFAEAEKYYNLGKFKDALEMYSKAYEVVQLSGFLFNIGQCHRMLGNYERAVFFYRGYLRGGRSIPNRSMVERLISDSERRMEEKKQEEERRKQEEARKRAALLKAQAAAAAAAAAARSKPYEPVPRRRRPYYKTWWFWTVIGAGTAAVVAAVVGGTIAATRNGGGGGGLPAGTLGTLDRR